MLLGLRVDVSVGLLFDNTPVFESCFSSRFFGGVIAAFLIRVDVATGDAVSVPAEHAVVLMTSAATSGNDRYLSFIGLQRSKSVRNLNSQQSVT